MSVFYRERGESGMAELMRAAKAERKKGTPQK